MVSLLVDAAWQRRHVIVWLVAVGLAAAALVAGRHLPGASQLGLGNDAFTYWEALRSPAPYDHAVVGGEGAYLYSPFFLQVLRPLAALPADVFIFGWTALLLVVAGLLGSRAPRWGRLPLALVVTLAMLDLWGGNIHILLAAALVLALRHPGAWSFLLLTKVTPGLAIAWHVVRREWRAVRVATAVTLALVGLSAILGPWAWFNWIATLLHHVNPTLPRGTVPVPFLIHAPLGLAILGWAAVGNRRWAVPVAALLLLPVIWPGGFALLLASVALAEPHPHWARELAALPAAWLDAIEEWPPVRRWRRRGLERSPGALR